MIEAYLYESLDQNKVRCGLCSHYCIIAPEKTGFCGVRKNIDGKLCTFNYGNLIAQHIDPIEKKPLYHVLPGSYSYSVASPGCNFRCGFCQNWEISQQNISDNSFFINQTSTPELVVKNTLKQKCKSISFTYTEPTVYFEFAYETSVIAKENNLRTILVSNGFFSEKALQKIAPYLDACNIDLKSYSENFYKNICKAHLEPVKNTIRLLNNMNIWTEITTLLVTGENDSVQELNRAAEFISEINRDIPWHVSRFFPQYKFSNYKPTDLKSIDAALAAGEKAGLNYVYSGNVCNELPTICPQCKTSLIIRSGYNVLKNEVIDGSCPHCKRIIPGIWK